MKEPDNIYSKMHVKSKFFIASCLGDLDLIKKIERRDKFPISWYKEAVLMASANGHIDIVSHFFQIKDFSFSSKEELEMLLLASANGRLNVVKYLFPLQKWKDTQFLIELFKQTIFYNQLNVVDYLINTISDLYNQYNSRKRIAATKKKLLDLYSSHSFKEAIIDHCITYQKIDMLKFLNAQKGFSLPVINSNSSLIKEGPIRWFLGERERLNMLSPIDTKIILSMQKEIKESDPIYWPSAFWNVFNDINLKQLKENGWENFKQNINQNYFNFIPLDYKDTFFRSMVSLLFKGKIRTFKRYKLYDPDVINLETHELKEDTRRIFGKDRKLQKRIYFFSVSLLCNYAFSIDSKKILQKIEEPTLGNPIEFRCGERHMSQDLANSVCEFYSIINASQLPQKAPPIILEIGAGYGRLAYVFLKALPCKYFIVDIPPALFISQKYLSTLFPKFKIFPFQKNFNFSKSEKELAACNLIFLTSNHLSQFPDEYFDLTINISSLHEMSREKIAFFLKEMYRVTNNYIYMKQYKEYKNPYDNIIIKEDEYPTQKGWKEVYNRTALTNNCFFEKLLRKSSPS